MQSVFIKLINNEPKFTSSEHEKAWLLKCAANHCKDILKSAWRKRTEFTTVDVASGPMHDDSNSALIEKILALPDKYKDVLYLHYYEGYKTDEIAKMTEKPASTIRNHLSEARKLLNQQLGGSANE